LKLQIAQLESARTASARLQALNEGVTTRNHLKDERLRSLLELVPDSTTLSSFTMEENGFEMAGETTDPDGLVERFKTALEGRYRLDKVSRDAIGNGKTVFSIRFGAVR
jgi:Tfp pilus assembly protein PilN